MVNKVGGGRLIEIIVLTFLLFFALASSAGAEEMTRVGAVTLDSGDNSGIGITNDGAYCYVSTYTSPARVVKVRLSDMTRVGAVTLNSGENWGFGITNDGAYCYVLTNTSPARVVKVRLSDMTRVGAVTLNSGESYGYRITNDGAYCYVSTDTSPARVVKVRLSDMTRVGAVTLDSGENSGYGITNDGTYCYVSTNTSPARVVKVRLSDMTRVGAVTLDSGDNSGYGITNDGAYCYVSTYTSPARVVKVRLSDMTRVGAVTLDSGESYGRGITNDGAYCYVSTYTSPARVVKVRLNNMTRVGAVTLDSGESYGRGITNDGAYCYVSTDTSPARVVKVGLPPAAPTGLTVSDITQKGATVTWDAITGADSYNIYLDGVPVYYTTETQYEIYGLEPGRNYTVEVRTVISNVESSPGECTASFTTKPAAPTGLTVSSITTTGATVTWDAITGADSYNIYLDGVPVYYTTETQYEIYGLESGRNYTVEVRTVISNVESSPGECTASFTTKPAAPTGLTVSSITTTGATVTWDAITGADSYNIYLDGVPVYYTTETQYEIYGLEPGRNYTVEVRTVISNVESSPGECTASFTTKPAAPTGLTVSSITTTGATVTWDAITGADSYNIYLDGVPVYNTTETQNEIYGLEPGRNYTVEVRTVINSVESSPEECTASFTTKSFLNTPSASVIASDVLSNTSKVLLPMGSLLALSLALKATPWLISITKLFFMK